MSMSCNIYMRMPGGRRGGGAPGGRRGAGCGELMEEGQRMGEGKDEGEGAKRGIHFFVYPVAGQVWWFSIGLVDFDQVREYEANISIYIHADLGSGLLGGIYRYIQTVQCRW